MGRPKLDLPFRQTTVLGTALQAAASSPFFQRVLVTQHQPSLALKNFTLVEIGEAASAGMHRSIRAGIGVLKPGAEAVAIALADHPFLTSQDYLALLAAWEHAKSLGKDLLYPTHQGRRGNPAVIGARYFPEILRHPDDDGGCRYLFEAHPERVFAWETGAEGFYRDLDLPEDYEACAN